MNRPPHNSDPTARDDDIGVLEVVRELTAELHRRPIEAQSVTLNSALDRDLGLDSLARVELVSRVERRFGVELPERVYAEAETPRDLLRALQQAESAAPPRAASSVPETPAAGDASPAPLSAETLIDVLAWHVEHHPDRTHIRLCNDGEGEEAISHRALWDGAQSIAAGLRARGVEPGEPVVLMLQTGRAYFYCFFGVLLAGGIPVPIYPPARPSQIEDHVRRQQGILINCRATTLITMPEATRVAHLLKSQAETLRHVVTADQLAREAAPGRPARGPRETAFIQYTSGSTGNPKGVVLTHANLLANIRTMGSHIRASPDDVFVSWLPLYHDMGLIGAWLGSLYYAAPFVVMSPLAFIARPQRWLRALHQHGGTLSASPNFGYELCVRRIEDADLEGLDLSAWRIAFNGAEPISPETLQRFYERFRHYGLRYESITPVYGLAECSVGLAFPPLARGPIIDHVRRAPFMDDRRAVPADPDDENALRFVGCGRAIADHEIRIVDDAYHELPERREGRLQFRGPSATGGYYRNPEATRRLFHGEWLESGDLAYFADGELYLTGRSKDIIIRAGRNLYPHELEQAVGEIEGVRAGRVAAFGSPDPVSGTERLVVVAETRERGEDSRLRDEINAAIADLTGDPPDDIMIAPPGTLLKTPSGKIRRTACRELYEQGLAGRRGRSVWWQLVRLGAAGLGPQLRRAMTVTVAALYALYAHALFWPAALLVWTLVIALPLRPLRWGVVGTAARALAGALGIRLEVRGRDALAQADADCILVSNHASYIDGALLVAALRRPVSFVAKAELKKNPLIGLFLRRIDTEFVERFDVARGLEDTRRLAGSAGQGRMLLFFPEGTFTRASGLLPFRMGAFVTAVESQLPIVPVAIRGSRFILRSESWWPRPGPVTVTFDAPIRPAASGAEGRDTWQTAVTLRDAAREAIRRHTGEPDLIEKSPLQGKTGNSA